jgi:PAS domain S-box-containing protein
LRQSEERFAKAFRLTPVPILICSADEQQVIDVNQAFLETLAYDSEDVLG